MSEERRETEIRASDSERERVVERLREASAEARLTLEELTERSEAAYGATTRGDLDALTRDLPAPSSTGDQEPIPAGSGSPSRRPKRWIVAVMGGSSRRGRWRPAESFNFIGVMGGATLDLRGAEVSGPEINITSVTVMGGLEVIVPEGVEVEVDGFHLMGGTDQQLADVPRQPGTPVVHIRAFSLMGGVNVRSKPPRSREGRSGARDTTETWDDPREAFREFTDEWRVSHRRMREEARDMHRELRDRHRRWE